MGIDGAIPGPYKAKEHKSRNAGAANCRAFRKKKVNIMDDANGAPKASKKTLAEVHAKAMANLTRAQSIQTDERRQALEDRRFYSIAGAQWEKSQAHLGILRADLHVVHAWDAMIEGRILWSPTTEQTDLGAVVGRCDLGKLPAPAPS